MTASSTIMPPTIGSFWRQATLFARAQIIGWSLFALVDLISRQLTYQDFTVALVLTALAYPLLIGLSLGLQLIYGRFFPSTGLSLPIVVALVLVSAAAASVVVATLSAARQIFGWSVPHWGPLEEVMLPFVYYTLVLTGWSILFFWIRADRQRQTQHAIAISAQSDALRAEIQQLRLQINPHFLFNALNGIAEEVPDHPDAALEMLRDLTDYLRHVLAGIRTPVVAVEAEVAALAAYLRIQQARFGERLRTEIETDPAAAGRMIANSLLQPLAENAVEHGDRSETLVLKVRIGVAGDALKIEIENTGRLEPAHKKRSSHGLGIENLRRRLDVHYPGRHSFDLRQIESEPTHVIATLLLEGEPCSAS